MLHIFSVVVFHRSLKNWNWGALVYALSICAFCYMLNIFSVVVFHTSMVNWRRGPNICVFCYMWNWFGVVVFHKSVFNWSWYISPMYMCNLQYMVHIFSVVVFYRSLINWNWGALVYVHSAIWETSNDILVFHTCMVNWRGYICLKYMCISLYVNVFGVVVFHRSIGICGKGGLGICAFCYMWNFSGVAVFQTSMVYWIRLHLP